MRGTQASRLEGPMCLDEEFSRSSCDVGGHSRHCIDSQPSVRTPINLTTGSVVEKCAAVVENCLKSGRDFNDGTAEDENPATLAFPGLHMICGSNFGYPEIAIPISGIPKFLWHLAGPTFKLGGRSTRNRFPDLAVNTRVLLQNQ